MRNPYLELHEAVDVLLVILVAGFEGQPDNERNEWNEPSLQGKSRMEKAASLLAGLRTGSMQVRGARGHDETISGRSYRAITLGGALEGKTSQADIYADYMLKKHNIEATALSGSFTTALDIGVEIERIASLMNQNGVIVLITNPSHGRRTARTLRWYLRRHHRSDVTFLSADSKEPQGYSWIMEGLSGLITMIDPGWRWLGKIAALYARRNRT